MKKLLIFTAALVGLHLGVRAEELPAVNPIVVGNTRVTVITPSLFRMEYAMQGRFVDDRTLFACNRSELCRDFKFSGPTAIRSRPIISAWSSTTTASRPWGATIWDST